MSQRATTREKRKAQFPATLPQRFMPRFLDQMDCRQTITKRLRQRVRDLVAESKATTPAQLILVQRVTFLEVHAARQAIEDAKPKVDKTPPTQGWIDHENRKIQQVHDLKVELEHGLRI